MGKAMFGRFNYYVSKLPHQVIFLIISIITISILFVLPLKRFNTTDIKPEFLSLVQTKTEEQKVLSASEIKVGLFVTDFPLLDIVEGKFILDGILWFEFNPHAISLENIGNFTIEKGEILKKSEPKTKLEKHLAFAQYQVRIEFKSDLDYRLFPIEDHRIFLMISNKTITPNEAIFTSYKTNLSISKNLHSVNWLNTGYNVDYGYTEAKLDKYSPHKTTRSPIVLFAFDFKQNGFKALVFIFAPFFLIFFMACFSLLINIENGRAILSLSIGSFTLFTFALAVIQGLSPDVRYFTIADKIYSILFLGIFLILLFNISLLRILSVKNQTKISFDKLKKRLQIIRAYIFFIFPIIIALFTFFTIY